MKINKDLEKLAKEKLIAKFNSITKLDDAALADINRFIIFETFKKNTVIIKNHQPVEHLYFIYSGVIRVYFYKNDKIIIERFEKEGGFFGGNYEHLSKYPGVHNYEALEDLTVLKIKHSDFENLFLKYHSVESLYRKILEAFHCTYVDKLYELKAATTQERYMNFEKEYGDIINRISLKNIASYLNMTSETVSRIRAKQSNS